MLRLPIWLYRARLGGLLGRRFVLIHHTGRTSRLARQVVLEVVERERASGAVVVAAGFGPRTQWYRNLLASRHPRAGRTLAHYTGIPAPSDEEGYRELGRTLPMLRLVPRG
jgi:deazaflavin-dependent oxidoreductase (nitroreductase family)